MSLNAPIRVGRRGLLGLRAHGQSVRFVTGVVVIAGGYYALAKTGNSLQLTGPAGAFWPATGLAGGVAIAKARLHAFNLNAQI